MGECISGQVEGSTPREKVVADFFDSFVCFACFVVTGEFDWGRIFIGIAGIFVRIVEYLGCLRKTAVAVGFGVCAIISAFAIACVVVVVGNVGNVVNDVVKGAR